MCVCVFGGGIGVNGVLNVVVLWLMTHARATIRWFEW